MCLLLKKKEEALGASSHESCSLEIRYAERSNSNTRQGRLAIKVPSLTPHVPELSRPPPDKNERMGSLCNGGDETVAAAMF